MGSSTADVAVEVLVFANENESTIVLSPTFGHDGHVSIYY